MVEAEALMSSIANFPVSLTISERLAVKTSSNGRDLILSKNDSTMFPDRIVVISEISDPIRKPTVRKKIIMTREIVVIAAGIFPIGFSRRSLIGFSKYARMKAAARATSKSFMIKYERNMIKMMIAHERYVVILSSLAMIFYRKKINKCNYSLF